jgi:hypothetical protein
LSDDFRDAPMSAQGREPVTTFFESCRSIAALSGARSNDNFSRLMILSSTPANDR